MSLPTTYGNPTSAITKGVKLTARKKRWFLQSSIRSGLPQKTRGSVFCGTKGMKKKQLPKEGFFSLELLCTTNVQTLQTMYCDVAKICEAGKTWKNLFGGQRVTKQRKALPQSQLWNGRVVYNKTENLWLLGPYFWGSGSEKCWFPHLLIVWVLKLERERQDMCKSALLKPPLVRANSKTFWQDLLFIN